MSKKTAKTKRNLKKLAERKAERPMSQQRMQKVYMGVTLMFQSACDSGNFTEPTNWFEDITVDEIYRFNQMQADKAIIGYSWGVDTAPHSVADWVLCRIAELFPPGTFDGKRGSYAALAIADEIAENHPWFAVPFMERSCGNEGEFVRYIIRKIDAWTEKETSPFIPSANTSEHDDWELPKILGKI